MHEFYFLCRLPGISFDNFPRLSRYESMRKSDPIKKIGQSHTEPLGIYFEREAIYMDIFSGNDRKAKIDERRCLFTVGLD